MIVLSVSVELVVFFFWGKKFSIGSFDGFFLSLFDGDFIFLNIDLFFFGDVTAFSIFNDSGISGLGIFYDFKKNYKKKKRIDKKFIIYNIYVKNN